VKVGTVNRLFRKWSAVEGAVIPLLSSPVGSMNRRRFKPSATRCLLTVRRLTTKPWRPSSKAMRDADYLRVRRKASIAVITSAVVVVD